MLNLLNQTEAVMSQHDQLVSFWLVSAKILTVHDAAQPSCGPGQNRSCLICLCVPGPVNVYYDKKNCETCFGVRKPVQVFEL